jgi:hypothetical protein
LLDCSIDIRINLVSRGPGVTKLLDNIVEGLKTLPIFVRDCFASFSPKTDDFSIHTDRFLNEN